MKLLSLSFWLFGNILANELVVIVLIVLVSSVALIVPIPVMLLVLFISGILALIFATEINKIELGKLNTINLFYFYEIH